METRTPVTTNEALVNFVNSKVNQRFTKSELKAYLEAFHFGTSFDTAERALRNLRNKGKLNYGVVNRTQGIFQGLPLGSTGTVEGTNPGTGSGLQGADPQRTQEE